MYAVDHNHVINKLDLINDKVILTVKDKKWSKGGKEHLPQISADSSVNHDSRQKYTHL